MRLSIRTPGRKRRIVEVDRSGIVIGRSSSCDVVVRERSVSSRHVQIVAGPVAIDLGSTNGTFVDGQKIDGVAALTGGRVSLGGPDDVVVEILDDADDRDEETKDRQAVSESSGRLENALAIFLAWKDHGLETPEELYARHPALKEQLEAMIVEEPDSDPLPAPPPEEQVLRALDRILAGPEPRRAGVYALGSALFFLCTGTLPTPPSRRSAAEASLDAAGELAPLIERATDDQVEKRFASLEEMIEAFRKVLAKRGGRGLLDRLRGPRSDADDA